MLNFHAAAAMVLTAVALYLFSREKLPIETSSLLIISLLAIGFTIFPFQTPDGELDPITFFAGFGNEALVAICALMMASQGLIRTGALAPLGRVVGRAWAFSPLLALLLVLLLSALVSGFMNNTPLVVLMIPILTAMAARAGASASKLLMPVTFASQVGGMSTPIGTSLNLLVIGTAAGLGVERFGMFDFYAPAVIAGSIAIAYLWLVAPRLLPQQAVRATDLSPRVFDAQLQLADESPAVDKSLSAIKKELNVDLNIVSILRRTGVSVRPLPDATIRQGDRLLLRDKSDKLLEAARVLQGQLYSGEMQVDSEHPLTAEDQQTAELVITQVSPLRDKTLAQASYDLRYQLVPLAIHRAGRSLSQSVNADLREVQLCVGDVLLVQAPADQIEIIKSSGDFMLLDATTDVVNAKKAPIAIAVMLGIVLLASFRLVPIAIAAIAGVLIMIVSGCLRWRDATHVLDSSLIFLTVASLALSHALMQTGGAAFVAQGLVDLSFGFAPVFVMSGVILLMSLLASVISNSAAAVIGTPIAVELARLLGVSPEPFVLAVLFGVNMSYATPMADNCNLLIYSAGNYSFGDFVRVGAPLVVIMWLAYSFLLPRFFPF